MAHKTRVNGTNYEISGGKTLIDGTAYSIKSGKTLVDGTAYEVGFAKPATITLEGYGYGYAYINIDGTTYDYPTTIEVPTGTVVECHVTSSYPLYALRTITVNGETVAEEDWNSDTISYLYTVTCSATIYVEQVRDKTSYGDVEYGVITITET